MRFGLVQAGAPQASEAYATYDRTPCMPQPLALQLELENHFWENCSGDEEAALFYSHMCLSPWC